MPNFSYEPPDSNQFLLTVKTIIKNKGSPNSKKVMDGTISCDIKTSGTFSRKRWDEYQGSISFTVKNETLSIVDNFIETEVLNICQNIIPSECGIGLYSIQFIPSLTPNIENENIIEDILQDKIIEDDSLIKMLLDTITIEKGKELSKIYNLLFVIENSLRNLIDLVFTGNFGNNYFSKINCNNQIKTNIALRKKEEEKNAWLRIRGTSDIFYLDFIDLSFIIKNNWEYFKDFFPTQSWIEVKIDELYKCRCLIAHNSNIGEHEVDVIKTNYKSILLQLRGKQLFIKPASDSF